MQWAPKYSGLFFGVVVQRPGERFILRGKVATLIRRGWTFVLLLVSPYFIDVAWQILRQYVLIFKVIRHNIGVSFAQAVRDNVVSSDVTLTSSLRSGVIILGINFSFS